MVAVLISVSNPNDSRAGISIFRVWNGVPPFGSSNTT